MGMLYLSSYLIKEKQTVLPRGGSLRAQHKTAQCKAVFRMGDETIPRVDTQESYHFRNAAEAPLTALR